MTSPQTAPPFMPEEKVVFNVEAEYEHEKDEIYVRCITDYSVQDTLGSPAVILEGQVQGEAFLMGRCATAMKETPDGIRSSAGIWTGLAESSLVRCRVLKFSLKKSDWYRSGESVALVATTHYAHYVLQYPTVEYETTWMKSPFALEGHAFRPADPADEKKEWITEPVRGQLLKEKTQSSEELARGNAVDHLGDDEDAEGETDEEFFLSSTPASTPRGAFTPRGSSTVKATRIDVTLI